MNYSYHWRKAMTISALLHILLIFAAGYLTAGWTAPIPVEEVLLEMDLVNDLVERAEIPQSIEPSPTIPAPSMPAPFEPLQTASEEKPVVTASALTMTEAPPPSVPVSSQPYSSAPGPKKSTSSRTGIAAPSILSKTAPAYPPAARKSGQEGTVVLRIEILATGRPGEISIATSSGYPALDEAAVASIRKWQFIPAKDLNNGKTVACTTTLPISFRLHN